MLNLGAEWQSEKREIEDVRVVEEKTSSTQTSCLGLSGLFPVKKKRTQGPADFFLFYFHNEQFTLLS
jgi:hypothetical protein